MGSLHEILTLKNSAELKLLNEKFTNESGAGSTEVSLKTTTMTEDDIFYPNTQPCYLQKQAPLKGKYLTKIAYRTSGGSGTMSIVFKNTDNPSTITDQSIDGVYCTITANAVGWQEYDLTNLDDPRISFATQNLTNGKIFIPESGRVIGFGQKDQITRVAFSYTAPSGNPDMAFHLANSGDVTTATLMFNLTTESLPLGSKKCFYERKKLSLLGDSITTYAGYIPAGYDNYYTGSNAGVSSVDQTWWKRVLDVTGMDLLVNNSWSGSRVTTTNGDASAGCMARATLLHSASDPDVIIVFMGYNDFNSEVAIGTYTGAGAFPTATTTFREAYAIMLDKILTRYKTAEVYCCTLPNSEWNDEATFPEMNSNDVLISTWNAAIKEIADLFGVPVIDLNKCGITHQNLDLYQGDWSGTQGLHPNAAGHRLLANKVIKSLEPPLLYSAL